MKRKILVDLTQEPDGTITNVSIERPWSIQDEAIHRGNNYAEVTEPMLKELMKDEHISVHAMLKNAYQEGFLHGFAHKFDDTNYEGDK